MRYCSAWSLSCASLLLLCWFYPGAESIVCYHCNSAYDPRCGDPFDPYSLGKINCSMQAQLEHLPFMEPTVCRKNVQRAYNYPQDVPTCGTNFEFCGSSMYGKTRVVRSCGYIEDPDRDGKACVQRSGTHDVHMLYCACKGDICNPAALNSPSTALAVFALTLVYVSML